MCSGSEPGSYLRRIAFVYHSTLGLRVIKKRRKTCGGRRGRKEGVARTCRVSQPPQRGVVRPRERQASRASPVEPPRFRPERRRPCSRQRRSCLPGSGDLSPRTRPSSRQVMRLFAHNLFGASRPCDGCGARGPEAPLGFGVQGSGFMIYYLLFSV